MSSMFFANKIPLVLKIKYTTEERSPINIERCIRQEMTKRTTDSGNESKPIKIKFLTSYGHFFILNRFCLIGGENLFVSVIFAVLITR